jgi:hypothetical protein
MKNHSMPNLKIRSLLLFSALTLGAALTAQAGVSAYSPYAPYAAPAAPGRSSAIATLSARPPLSSAQAAFKRADTSADGKLSRQELEHFPAMAPHFRLIDGNRDGFVSFEELILAATEKPADPPVSRQALTAYSSSAQAASFRPATGARGARVESAP